MMQQTLSIIKPDAVSKNLIGLFFVTKLLIKMLQVLHEDANCVIVNKPAGLPTQPDKTNNRSALDIVARYLNQKAFIVNRLDRPTSGILLFAKTSNSAGKFSALFQKDKVKKNKV